MKKYLLAVALLLAQGFASAETALLFINQTGASDGHVANNGFVPSRVSDSLADVGDRADSGGVNRAWFIFNISSIPSTATISQVNFSINFSVAVADSYCSIKPIAANASDYAADDAGNLDFYADIGNGTVYYNGTFCTSTGLKQLTLGSQAVTDLQNKLGLAANRLWFGLGINSTENGPGPTGRIASNEEPASSNRPALIITYSAGGDSTSPLVSLNAPSNNSVWANATLALTCTASDGINVANVTLYGNWSGGWHANSTNSSPQNSSAANFTANLTEGVYAWNCRGVDNSSNAAFASGNYTVRVDRASPAYAGNLSNTTTGGRPVLYSLYWTETVAGFDSYIFSFDNGTGTFVNDSSTPFTGNANWSNVTKATNGTNGSTIRWRVWTNDTAGNSNVSAIYSFTATLDTAGPLYAANSTSSTVAGGSVEFRLYWTDDNGLSHYIFSLDNGTGTFVNDSAAAITGAANWSNLTKLVNATSGSTIRWRVWANDTSGNANNSAIYSFTTTSDSSAPAFSANTTNSTVRAIATLFSVRWEDDGTLAGYIFSFDNGNGTFYNETYAAFTGAVNFSNVTKIINSTYGSTVRWQVYANDTAGRMNATPIYSFTAINTTNTPPVVTNVNVLPLIAYATTPLNCSASVTDPENTTVTLMFTWWNNNQRNTTWDVNVTAGNNTAVYTSYLVNTTALKNGDDWTCSVRGYDGIHYGEWANSTKKTIGGGSSQSFTRISIDCPASTTNKTAQVIVSYYLVNTRQCEGIAVTGAGENGTSINNAISYAGCNNSRAAYRLQFNESGNYVITASSTTISGVSASCTITYRLVQVLATRVPEMHPLLVPLIAFLALLIMRKSEGIRRNRG